MVFILQFPFSYAEGMCKHHYGNQNFPPFASTIYFIVVYINKIPLGNGNRPFMDSNTKMCAAHAFEPNLQISYENPMFRRQLQVVVFPHLGIPGMVIMASCKAFVVGYIAPSTLSLTFFISSCTQKSKNYLYFPVLFKNMYCTRAIISRGLYSFLPNFHFGCGLYCRQFMH